MGGWDLEIESYVGGCGGRGPRARGAVGGGGGGTGLLKTCFVQQAEEINLESFFFFFFFFF